MKTFTIYTAMAIFGALAHAVPLQAESRQTHEVELTFRGAPPDVAFFKQSFPTNGALTRIGASPCSSSSLSLSSLRTSMIIILLCLYFQ
jgi:hypothetical protein